MGKVVKINKGLDIPLKGKAEKTITPVEALTYALKPTDFTGVFPKLLLKDGAKVKAGTAIFYDKYNDSVKFTSPVSGTIRAINRGPKRVIEEIVIDPDGNQEYETFEQANPQDLDAAKIRETLLESGLWPAIRRRPFDVIARPEDEPKAIFISALDTHPLAPDLSFIAHGKGKEFQRGLDALSKLTNGKIHLNIKAKDKNSGVFTNAKGVQINEVHGPHPAGNVGTQINKIDPINKEDIVWHVNVQDVITIGNLFLTGKYDATKIVALTGSEVKKPQYYKLINGASIEPLVKNNLINDHVRYISGNVLTGSKIYDKGYIGYYDHQISVIPEGDHYEFVGWAAPGFNKFSISKTYFSWLRPGKKYRIDTNLKGGPRAMVMTGYYEKVFPLDIFPMQLIKSIMIEDIEEMEKLGIYEIAPEDFALCEFIDTSKTEIQSIVREGLESARKELM
ncbi:MAG: Na(+)-translocating NADH-quinone reductase subunit A [Bacteroidales bacterium]|nr:Na(+)-translocating NADH-quinone reductase subunit A [Bacteroidales bacterium]MCF8327199.1 Na(+)-translocating NADH-quinone reductase subunit A [Bacteroidales bacterium]MCF8339249.1 Na(+)-translocating NADH-quinone reductase subunit A [Bacteroidales bacterium]